MKGDRDFNRYRVESQQRVLRVLLHLSGHETNGLGAAEISKALEISAPNVHRDLANLALGGLAEQLPDTGRWRLGPRVPQIGLAVLRGLDRAEARTAEVKQRYTRDPS